MANNFLAPIDNCFLIIAKFEFAISAPLIHVFHIKQNRLLSKINVSITFREAEVNLQLLTERTRQKKQNGVCDMQFPKD